MPPPRAGRCVPFHRPALLPAGLLLLSAALSPALGAQENGDDDPPLPLEPARSFPVDLSEGTWMSVDVSPDGRTLVFDYLGNLFTLPIEGGEARALSTGMAFDAQPRFSPDGERVVFTSDRSGGQNIWILSLDGVDTIQLTRGGANRAESPVWTPDGEYVVASLGDFRGQQNPTLRLYHVEGGSGVRLLDEDDDRKALGAAFGPDPRYVWFSQRTGSGDWTYNAQLPQYQVRVYDRETGRSFTRTSRYGSGLRPTLSPDGRWLVYGTRHDGETGLVLRDLETGDERWLAYPVQNDDQESRATLDVLPGMAFTPDSEALVASWGGRLWRIPIREGADPEEIPFRIRFEQELGPEVAFDYPVADDPTFLLRQIRDAVPSPDGERIAFTALQRLWIADGDGTNPRSLTDVEVVEQFPSWSPDGRWVAYVTWDGYEGHLWKVRADGSGGPIRLSRRSATWLAPAWSPDGTRVVGLRGHARGFLEATGPGGASQAAEELAWVPTEPEGGPDAPPPAQGSEARIVAPLDGRSHPHFTRNPERIFLSAPQGWVVSIRWDGTDERRHVRVQGSTPPGASEPQNASLVLMSPDGATALADVSRQLYTVTVPRVGPEGPTISVANPEGASFPVRRLTEVGGEFPTWSADGGRVHWSLGRHHFMYDLRAARQHEAETADADDEDREPYRPGEFPVEIQVERDIPRGTVALRRARIVTMRGDEVLEEGDVVIRDRRIAAVGPTGEVEIPDGAVEFDLAGHTIVPGFVDTHAHLRPAFGLHREDLWVYLANLAYGVTTTRDPQTGTTDVLTYADLVRSGRTLGPRIYSTGPGMSWQEEIRDLDHARTLLRRYAEYFDTKTIKMYVAGNRQQRQWIIVAARELELMPTTEGSLNIKQNLNETVDGYPGLEHSLPIHPVFGDVTALFAASGRVYTPTLLVAYGGPWAENYFFSEEEVHDDPKLRRFTPHEVVDRVALRRGQWFHENEHVFRRHAGFVRDLVEAGGKAGVGSHGQLQGLGYHWELWAMASGGLSPHDALRVATQHGAEAIGLAGDLGSIEEGKLADLVILEGNPLEDIRHTNTIRKVMMNGRLFDGETLAELHPRERDLEPLWWWDREPAGLSSDHGPIRGHDDP
jgi:Tol biopolymer transport system component/imidazolonepropionase-like amidohydrolase